MISFACDKIINVIPVSSGIYYFGFHDKSLFTKAALILDNISLEKTPACRLAKIENSVIDFSAMLYPNPVGDVTTLSLNLQHNAHVIIRILDILGNEVLNICDNYFDEGNNSIVIETQYLTPGAYFCVMNVDGTMVSKQLLKN